MKRILIAVTTLLAGCSAYRLGGGDPIFRDIEVAPTRSSVARPGVLPAMDQALRAALAGESRLRLRTGGAKLELEVVDFERSAVTRSRSDATLATYYRISLRAVASLRSADGQRSAFVNRTFEANAVLEASGDLAGEQSRILPRLAAEIAAQVKDASIGAW